MRRCDSCRSTSLLAVPQVYSETDCRNTLATGCTQTGRRSPGRHPCTRHSARPTHAARTRHQAPVRSVWSTTCRMERAAPPGRRRTRLNPQCGSLPPTKAVLKVVAMVMLAADEAGSKGMEGATATVVEETATVVEETAMPRAEARWWTRRGTGACSPLRSQCGRRRRTPMQFSSSNRGTSLLALPMEYSETDCRLALPHCCTQTGRRSPGRHSSSRHSAKLARAARTRR